MKPTARKVENSLTDTEAGSEDPQGGAKRRRRPAARRRVRVAEGTYSGSPRASNIR